MPRSAKKRAAANTPARLNVPAALTGQHYTGLIVGTYGADLEFLERFWFPRLPRSISSRVVLADNTQLHRALSRRDPVRRMNRAYVAAPVRSPRAHHPKFLLATGPNAGTLLVGSGNASVPGYTGLGEMFTQYTWTEDDTTHLAAFTAIVDYLTTLHAQYPLDPIAWHLIDAQLKAAAWLPATAPTEPSPVVHNLTVPMLDHLTAAVGTAPVTDLIMYAPFHDHTASAVRTLLTRLRPAKATLLIQQQQTTVDIAATRRAVRRFPGPFTVAEIYAPDEPRTFLHAKFVLVRTRGRDVLLHGSPNLSAVALTHAGTSANVEIANLLTGRTGAFADVLNTVTITAIPRGLTDVTPADPADDTDPVDATTDLLRDVRWQRPTLTGFIATARKVSRLTVYAQTKRLRPAAVHLTSDTDGYRFTVTLPDKDANLAERADYLVVHVPGYDQVRVYPYRVHELMRMASTGQRVDLLTRVGNLDLNDKELADLLSQLEVVLIVDGRTVWRLAHPDDVPDDEPGTDTPKINYADLDWERINSTPTVKAYKARLAGTFGASPDELSILLHSLLERFHVETNRSADIPGGGDDEDDLADVSDNVIENEDEADDAADPETDADRVPATRAPGQRRRRLWRSFIKRYVSGLSDPGFLASVGPSVVIPTYVIFNHLLRRLRSRDLADPDFLTAAQVRMWTFMWGDARGEPGYLAGLDPADRAAAVTLIVDHHDSAVTLAAAEDAYYHVWATEQDLHGLRDAIRGILANQWWTVTVDDLADAATVSTAAPEYVTGPEILLREIRDLATHATTNDLDRELAAAVGLPFTDLRWSRETVSKRKQAHKHPILKLPAEYTLTVDDAAALFDIWQRVEPDRDHLRITAGRRTAIVDRVEGQRFLYDRDTDIKTPIPDPTGSRSAWEARLSNLAALLAA